MQVQMHDDVSCGIGLTSTSNRSAVR